MMFRLLLDEVQLPDQAGLLKKKKKQPTGEHQQNCHAGNKGCKKSRQRFYFTTYSSGGFSLTSFADTRAVDTSLRVS